MSYIIEKKVVKGKKVSYEFEAVKPTLEAAREYISSNSRAPLDYFINLTSEAIAREYSSK